MNKSFVVHAEYLLDIPPENKSQFYEYILDYGIFGIVPEVTGFELKAWKSIQRRIDQDRLKYEQQTVKKRINSINKRIRDENATPTDLANLELYTKEYDRLTTSIDELVNSYSSYNTNNSHTGVSVSVFDTVSVSDSVYVSVSDNEYVSGETSKEVSKAPSKFKKPTIEEIEAYIYDKGYDIDAESFWNFYESKGWKVGNSPMKNWKSAIITWAKRQKESRASSFGSAFKSTATAEDEWLKKRLAEDALIQKQQEEYYGNMGA